MRDSDQKISGGTNQNPAAGGGHPLPYPSRPRPCFVTPNIFNAPPPRSPSSRASFSAGLRLELRSGVGGVDVVGAKEHQFASDEPVAECGETQLVVVVILSIDDDAVDIDARVEHRQLTPGRQLPQTDAAVRRTGRHELVARGYARAQHLHS